ncbi:hypothetical protein HDU67_001935 [Dinochytrium kinnereticum]|nr:hypothetical protein HDU67_001935 [Dinochytrium kinnereticum]
MNVLVEAIMVGSCAGEGMPSNDAAPCIATMHDFIGGQGDESDSDGTSVYTVAGYEGSDASFYSVSGESESGEQSDDDQQNDNKSPISTSSRDVLFQVSTPVFHQSPLPSSDKASNSSTRVQSPSHGARKRADEVMEKLQKTLSRGTTPIKELSMMSPKSPRSPASDVKKRAEQAMDKLQSILLRGSSPIKFGPAQGVDRATKVAGPVLNPKTAIAQETITQKILVPEDIVGPCEEAFPPTIGRVENAITETLDVKETGTESIVEAPQDHTAVCAIIKKHSSPCMMTVDRFSNTTSKSCVADPNIQSEVKPRADFNVSSATTFSGNSLLAALEDRVTSSIQTYVPLSAIDCRQSFASSSSKNTLLTALDAGASTDSTRFSCAPFSSAAFSENSAVAPLDGTTSPADILSSLLDRLTPANVTSKSSLCPVPNDTASTFMENQSLGIVGADLSIRPSSDFAFDASALAYAASSATAFSGNSLLAALDDGVTSLIQVDSPLSAIDARHSFAPCSSENSLLPTLDARASIDSTPLSCAPFPSAPLLENSTVNTLDDRMTSVADIVTSLPRASSSVAHSSTYSSLLPALDDGFSPACESLTKIAPEFFSSLLADSPTSALQASGNSALSGESYLSNGTVDKNEDLVDSIYEQKAASIGLMPSSASSDADAVCLNSTENPSGLEKTKAKEEQYEVEGEAKDAVATTPPVVPNTLIDNVTSVPCESPVQPRFDNVETVSIMEDICGGSICTMELDNEALQTNEDSEMIAETANTVVRECDEIQVNEGICDDAIISAEIEKEASTIIVDEDNSKVILLETIEAIDKQARDKMPAEEDIYDASISSAELGKENAGTLAASDHSVILGIREIDCEFVSDESLEEESFCNDSISSSESNKDAAGVLEESGNADEKIDAHVVDVIDEQVCDETLSKTEFDKETRENADQDNADENTIRDEAMSVNSSVERVHCESGILRVDSAHDIAEYCTESTEKVKDNVTGSSASLLNASVDYVKHVPPKAPVPMSFDSFVFSSVSRSADDSVSERVCEKKVEIQDMTGELLPDEITTSSVNSVSEAPKQCSEDTKAAEVLENVRGAIKVNDIQVKVKPVEAKVERESHKTDMLISEAAFAENEVKKDDESPVIFEDCFNAHSSTKGISCHGVVAADTIPRRVFTENKHIKADSEAELMQPCRMVHQAERVTHCLLVMKSSPPIPFPFQELGAFSITVPEALFSFILAVFMLFYSMVVKKDDK